MKCRHCDRTINGFVRIETAYVVAPCKLKKGGGLSHSSRMFTKHIVQSRSTAMISSEYYGCPKCYGRLGDRYDIELKLEQEESK